MSPVMSAGLSAWAKVPGLLVGYNGIVAAGGEALCDGEWRGRYRCDNGDA